MRIRYAIGLFLGLMLIPRPSFAVIDAAEILGQIEYQRQERCKFDIAARSEGKVALFTRVLDIPAGFEININFDALAESPSQGTEDLMTKEQADLLEGKPVFFQKGKMFFTSANSSIDQPDVIFFPGDNPPKYFSNSEDGFAKPNTFKFVVAEVTKTTQELSLPTRRKFTVFTYTLRDENGNRLKLDVPIRLSKYRVFAAVQRFHHKNDEYDVSVLLEALGTHVDLGDKLVEPSN